MTTNKRKKVVKYRGSHTHGGGAKKKRRGAGHRGGRGMAGSGKRADQKKPTILKLYGSSYFGKRGFRVPGKKKNKFEPVNLGYLNEILADLLQEGKIKKEGNKYIVELNKIGYHKVLGKGDITNQVHIIGKVSSKAKEKIEAKKGSVQEEK